jgi:hypothetical protein
MKQELIDKFYPKDRANAGGTLQEARTHGENAA